MSEDAIVAVTTETPDVRAGWIFASLCNLCARSWPIKWHKAGFHRNPMVPYGQDGEWRHVVDVAGLPGPQVFDCGANEQRKLWAGIREVRAV